MIPDLRTGDDRIEMWTHQGIIVKYDAETGQREELAVLRRTLVVRHATTQE